MDFDFDPFDNDSPSPATSLPRFKPKAKAKAKPPPRKNSSSIPSASNEIPSAQASSSTSLPVADATKPAEVVHVADVSVPDNPSVESVRTEEPLGNDNVSPFGILFKDDSRNSGLVNCMSEFASNGDMIGSVDVVPLSEVARRPNDDGDRHSSSPDCLGENVDICLESEGLDHILSQSKAPMDGAAREFTTMVDENVQPANEFPVTFSVTAEADSSFPVSDRDLTPSNAMIREEEVCMAVPFFEVVDKTGMAVLTSKVEKETGMAVPTSEVEEETGMAVPTSEVEEETGMAVPSSAVDGETATFRETAALDKDGVFQVDDGGLETEAVEAFPCLDTIDIFSESVVASGQRSGKFMPKPKGRTATKAVESLSCLQDDQLIPPEAENVDGSTTSAFQMDNAPKFFSTDPTSEFHVDVEPANPVDTMHSGSVSRMVGNLNGESRKRKSPSISDLSEKAQKISTDAEDRAGASSGKLRKRVATHSLVDEPDDNTQRSGDIFAENPVSVGNEDGDECRVEISSRKKQVSRKSKKSVSENGKPGKKRKKAVENTEQLSKEPPKRFPRSTRRNRRCVDKVLLETPEDELDRQNIRIKDLILLAEYKEKMNKEAAALKIPPTNQSSENYDPEDAEFASDQDRGSFDGEENVIQEDTAYFNYQTFMDKVPTIRWSKQDTELFYQAVRQFGADISMIQQLFPNRTRRQVKLKYKKEERQHPLRLDDALRSRSKDHSHYRQVIEQLKKAAAGAKQDANEDEPTSLTDDETAEAETVAPPQNEEGEKTEQVEAETEPAEVQGASAGAAEGPPNSQDSDDDFLDWSQYTSIF